MANVLPRALRGRYPAAYLGGLLAGVGVLGLAYLHDRMGAPPLSAASPRAPPPPALEAPRVVVTPARARPPRPRPSDASCDRGQSGADIELGLRVERPAPGRFVIRRAELTRAIEANADFVRCGQIMPVFRGGVQQGYLLLSVRPWSVHAQLGLRSGDLVRRVNGIELSSPARALEAYGALGSDRLDVDVVRRGEPVRLSYELR